MGTIDQKMNDYVRDNLDELKSIFSEKVYRVLLRFKDQTDKEGFRDTLEVILDSDKELFTKIENIYQTAKIENVHQDIENMSIKEIIQVFKIFSLEDVLEMINYRGFMSKTIETFFENELDNKKKYIKRVEYWVDTYTKEDENYTLLLDNIAHFYMLSDSDSSKIESLYQRVLKIRKKILGEEHPDTIKSYNNLATYYLFEDEYEEAKELYQKVLEMRKKILGERNSDTIKSYDILVNLYAQMKEYQKAKDFCQKVLRIKQEEFGEEHPSTAYSYFSLARLYQLIEEYQESEFYFIKALKIAEIVWKEKPLYKYIYYFSLADLYLKNKEYQKARPLFLKAMEINKSKEIPHNIEEHYNGFELESYDGYKSEELADFYQSINEYQKAESIYLQHLKIYEKENINSELISIKLAELYKSMGKYQEAEKIYLNIEGKDFDTRVSKRHPI